MDMPGTTHDEEKQYKCDLCNNTFARSYNIKIHFRTHSGENHTDAVYVTKHLHTQIL